MVRLWPAGTLRSTNCPMPSVWARMSRPSGVTTAFAAGVIASAPHVTDPTTVPVEIACAAAVMLPGSSSATARAPATTARLGVGRRIVSTGNSFQDVQVFRAAARYEDHAPRALRAFLLPITSQCAREPRRRWLIPFAHV